MLAVLLSCVLVEQTSALPDIAGIISGLSQKAMGILKGLSLPVLNSQVGFIRQHIDGLLSFFKDKEGDVSKTIIKAVLHLMSMERINRTVRTSHTYEREDIIIRQYWNEISV